jgi:hypothetical protein
LLAHLLLSRFLSLFFSFTHTLSSHLPPLLSPFPDSSTHLTPFTSGGPITSHFHLAPRTSHLSRLTSHITNHLSPITTHSDLTSHASLAYTSSFHSVSLPVSHLRTHTATNYERQAQHTIIHTTHRAVQTPLRENIFAQGQGE